MDGDGPSVQIDPLAPMIRVAQSNGQPPINLLQQHYPDELMRQSDGPEGYSLAGAPQKLARKAIGAADQEGKRLCSRGASAREKICEFDTVQTLAALVERDAESALAFRDESFAFLAPACRLIARAAFGNLDHIRSRESQFWSQFGRAFEVALGQLPLRPGFQAPNGTDEELQRCIRARSGASAFRGFGGTILPPDFLEVVEGADFRPEDVNHEIASINEHPIAQGNALDADRSMSRLLEGANHGVGNRAHMSLRTTGGYDHRVGDRGFASKVDIYDRFGLHVVQHGEGDGEEIDSRRQRLGGDLGERLTRFTSRLMEQRQIPFSSADPNQR